MMIVNDATGCPRVFNYAPKVVNQPLIMLLENIYRTGFTHDDHIFKVLATGVNE